MWCSSPGSHHLVPTDSLVIGIDAIKPVATMKDIGMYLDATISMRDQLDHIRRLTSTCIGVLRQIRCIRRSLSSYTHTMLITCFVFARLDNCNLMFTGLPCCELERLQSVQNAAVRLLSGARKLDHQIVLAIKQLWSPICTRDRSFAVAEPRLRNSLSASVTSTGSLAAFNKQFKPFLFSISYDDWHINSHLTLLFCELCKAALSDLSPTLLNKL